MTSGLLTTDVKQRKIAINDLMKALTSGQPVPTFFEDLPDLTLSALKSAVSTADAASSANLNDANLRMRTAWAYALARDAEYALATGLHHFTLGEDNALRGLYEVARVDQYTTNP